MCASISTQESIAVLHGAGSAADGRGCWTVAGSISSVQCGSCSFWCVCVCCCMEPWPLPKGLPSSRLLHSSNALQMLQAHCCNSKGVRGTASHQLPAGVELELALQEVGWCNQQHTSLSVWAAGAKVVLGHSVYLCSTSAFIAQHAAKMLLSSHYITEIL
mmetsp:Transcript_25421/g.69063  ORF Transcript_25421/g.69063 Transcript_25421/m.69063 type:complete len:160 (+) Transcript_25421:232-711(+)